MKARALLGMTKPRISLMVALAVVAGYVVGEGNFGQVEFWAALLGILAMGASSSVLNQVLEIEFDARMDRTRERPLPSGVLSWWEATAFGVGLAGFGALALSAFSNQLTLLLTSGTLLSYLFLYTPLKRVTSLNTVIGAVPGAMPPVLGWTAATGTLGPEAFALFAILFVWQLPHFLSIAWIYRDDYAAGGYRMLPFFDADGSLTARQMIGHAVSLLLVSLIPVLLGMAGPVYVLGALAFGGAFLRATCHFGRGRSVAAARRVLFSSLIYLPGVYVLLALGL